MDKEELLKVNIIGKDFDTQIEVSFMNKLIYRMFNAKEDFFLEEFNKLQANEKENYYNKYFNSIKPFLKNLKNGKEKSELAKYKFMALFNIQNELKNNLKYNSVIDKKDINLTPTIYENTELIEKERDKTLLILKNRNLIFDNNSKDEKEYYAYGTLPSIILEILSLIEKNIISYPKYNDIISFIIDNIFDQNEKKYKKETVDKALKRITKTPNKD